MLLNTRKYVHLLEKRKTTHEHTNTDEGGDDATNFLTDWKRALRGGGEG